MIIRTASFRDLARIEQLYRDAVEADELGVSPSPDSPVPQATLLRLWHALTKSLSSLVPLTDSADALLVAEDAQEGVVGFIQAQAPPGRSRSWQIINLCTFSTAIGHFAREQLLAALCNHGLEHGVHRFHVRLPLEHPLVPVFLAHHFTQFATEQILYRDAPPEEEGSSVRSALLRPARRDDIASIYLLYLRTTPSQVADFEGASLNLWQGAYAQGLVARMGREDVRHYVVEHPGLVAWAAIRAASSTQPTQLTLMCEGHDATLRDAIIDAVLRELPAGPVACVLRHYNSELIRALQGRGFAVYGMQMLLVCDLGSKVRLRQSAQRKKPILVQAGVARSVATEPQATLRVLGSRREAPGRSRR